MRRPLLFLVAAAVPLILYARTATFGFVHADDADLIAGNRAFLSDARNLPRAFTRSYFEIEGELGAQKTYYRPLAIVSFMADAAIGGADPRSYHATNVVLHAAVVCLAAWLALAWGASRAAALAAALIFAVHPVNVQAVAWIAGRNELLVAAFGLLSLVSFAASAGRATIPAAAHVLSFAAALFSKETGLLFPLVAVIHQRAVRRERVSPLQWIALTGDVLVVIAWTVLRTRALAGAMPELSAGSLSVAGSNAPHLLLHVRKMLVPMPLNVAPGVRDLDLLLAAAVLVVLAIAATRYLSRTWQLVGGAWVLMFLAPPLLVPGLPAYEHRAYVPLLALLITFAAGSMASFSRREIAGMTVVLLTVTATFAAIAYRRQDVFRDAYAYWRDAARDPRFGPLAHVNLGQLYEADGRPGDARREYLRALERDPATPKAHNNLGVVLMALGEPDLALAHFQEETRRHAWNADAWFNLGLVMERRGDHRAARQYYERAIDANPAYAPAYDKLGRRAPGR